MGLSPFDQDAPSTDNGDGIPTTNLGSQQVGGPSVTGVQPDNPKSAATFGDLSDPNAWMQLVGNPDQLKAWIKSKNPGWSDGLVNYYAGVIQKQPGATPGEQGGSAAYYSSKFSQDPFYGGSGGGQYAQGGPFPAFQPPSYQDFLNSPGLQFGLNQGLKAITENGSAKGTALGGPQLKALSDYATNYGLTQYGNVFNQALATNQQNFGINQGNFGNLSNFANWGINAVNGAGA